MHIIENFKSFDQFGSLKWKRHCLMEIRPLMDGDWANFSGYDSQN